MGGFEPRVGGTSYTSPHLFPRGVTYRENGTVGKRDDGTVAPLPAFSSSRFLLPVPARAVVAPVEPTQVERHRQQHLPTLLFIPRAIQSRLRRRRELPDQPVRHHFRERRARRGLDGGGFCGHPHTPR